MTGDNEGSQPYRPPLLFFSTSLVRFLLANLPLPRVLSTLDNRTLLAVGFFFLQFVLSLFLSNKNLFS